MRDVSILNGVWIYRSFLNSADMVGDFRKLAVWEAELSFGLADDGRLYGFLGERPEEAIGNEPYLTIDGRVQEGDPSRVSWRAKGKPGSTFEGWIYDYVGYLSPEWADATRPRAVISGTVTRTVAHGNNAPAGAVFSFYAVKKDFREPRLSHPLAKPVIDLMASAEHRYHHALWHASRDEWAFLSAKKRAALQALGWQPGPLGAERASLGVGRVTNGSGEDFLYMHRRMVHHVRGLDPSVRSWPSVPSPKFPVSFAAGTKASTSGNVDGNAFADPWIVPGDPDQTNWLVEVRKTSTLYSKFAAWEALYTDPRYLASISLAELGSRIEFTIHNWMHMRWASLPRDPNPDPDRHGLPIPEGRQALDFDPKWLSPEYDFLGETFSSHVNPIFWRLHGWVDDRIEDWSRAQEVARPGAITRKTLGGVQWFEADKQWVLVEEPWEGLKDVHGAGHGGHGASGHGDLLLDIPTMQQALTVIFDAEPGANALAVNSKVKANWFKRLED
ncbi:PvdJ/PvdD/PvdP-like protein [Pseudomonas sp. NPDC098740]|uniref:PvdJ/PvdD/PvdP-like protein n=1 Tax=Pseudomonas sp. NPDC098740 TaxID=3364486 RepID=UPI00383A3857